MTSNLGSSVILEETNRETQKEIVMKYVRNTFRPEFVNRIDEYIIFDSLRMDQIRQIVRLQVTNAFTNPCVNDGAGDKSGETIGR